MQVPRINNKLMGSVRSTIKPVCFHRPLCVTLSGVTHQHTVHLTMSQYQPQHQTLHCGRDEHLTGCLKPTFIWLIDWERVHGAVKSYLYSCCGCRIHCSKEHFNWLVTITISDSLSTTWQTFPQPLFSEIVIYTSSICALSYSGPQERSNWFFL